MSNTDNVIETPHIESIDDTNVVNHGVTPIPNLDKGITPVHNIKSPRGGNKS